MKKRKYNKTRRREEVEQIEEPKQPAVLLPPPEYEPPDVSDTLSPEDFSRLALPPKIVTKPDISHLPDALSGGWPTFKEGDLIVIERYADCLRGRPYLDTRTYRVKSVDLVTGRVELYDDCMKQHAMDNWRQGIRIGQVYKFAKGGPVTTKKKRGRPRKSPVETDVQPVIKVEEVKAKRGRGRPKGVKNRPKEVIEAERKAKLSKKK